MGPLDKAETVRSLNEGGRITAMVGDGVNDAPALSAAHLGIAVSGGTHIAQAYADIVIHLKGDGAAGVARAFLLSRAAMRIIKQNLCWAFGYNLLALPMAMGALKPLGGPFISPGAAAAAMCVSSVVLVLNALRLRKWKPSC
jgi:Cu+-exporting ATPase